MLPTPAKDDAARALQRIRALGEPPRFWELNRLEALWNGQQYAGRPSFWDAAVPLRERAPLVVYPLARIAGERLAALVFGEGRFPALTLGEGGSDLSGVALTPAEAQLLAEGAKNVVAQAKLRLRMREALREGLKCGTAAAVCSLQDGRLCAELIPAKWCTPTFAPGSAERVVRLEVRYRAEGPPGPDGQPTDVWYRRVITEREDREWRDVPADPEGYEPDWDAAPSRAFEVEFCPVVWVRNLPDPGCPGLDGVALAEGLEDEIEALDRALSMRHRNGLYNGEPQMLITGAAPEDATLPQGRAADASVGWLKGWRAEVLGKNGKTAVVPGAAGGAATQRAPGTVWWVPKPDADGKLLETNGAGAQVLQGDADALRRMILEAMSVVIPDADKATVGDPSGAGLRILHAPMLALADNLRECWGDALLRIVGTLLRLLTTRAAAGADGRAAVHGIPHADALRLVLAKFARPVLGPGGTPAGVRWFDPPFALTWGEYFEPGLTDLLTSGQAAAAVAPILDRRTIVARLAPLWGASDVEAAMAAKADEDGVAQAALAQTLGALGPAGADPAAPGDPAAAQAAGAAQGAQHPAFQAQQAKLTGG